jgi:hypothetical protein
VVRHWPDQPMDNTMGKRLRVEHTDDIAKMPSAGFEDHLCDLAR